MVIEKKDNDIIFEGQGRIVDETCKCGHLKSRHMGIENHGGCKECNCIQWSFSNRWVITDLEKIKVV